MSELEFPAWYYGSYAEVHKAAGKAATQLLRGATFDEIGGQHWVRVDESSPGLIVLSRSWSMIDRNKPQFHADLLWKITFKRLRKNGVRDCEVTRLVKNGIKAPWSFSGILREHFWLLDDVVDQLEYLDACVENWPSLMSAGPRFTLGADFGESLADVPTLAQYCLSLQGTSIVELQEPLTAQRLSTFVERLPGEEVRSLIIEGCLAEARLETEKFCGRQFLKLVDHFVGLGHLKLAVDIVTSDNRADPEGLKACWMTKNARE